MAKARGIIWTTLIALSAAPATTLAQSPQSANATATITVAQQPLSLATIQNFDFGTVFTSAGIVPSGGTNFARWDGQATLNNTIIATFMIPTVLVGVGTSQNVPFTCGIFSANIKHGATSAGFNPSIGLPNYTLSVDGNFIITLGEGVSPGPLATELCHADVRFATADTYTGTITLTIAIM